jgi:F-type H+-transporting ATPase subunit epsilon
MNTNLMNLKILLPFKVFADMKNINRIVMETSEGSYGLLPQRLDCVAALVPGIFTYETESGEIHYVAVDEGVMIKAGDQVLVSVRNAIGGADLGKLGDLVKKDFQTGDENQKEASTVVAKLEMGFIYSFDKLHKN